MENLLLKEKVSPDQPLRVKIADFGLSKLYSGNSMHTGISSHPSHPSHFLFIHFFLACGTPFYVAPDILMAADDDDAGYGPPVDMWAVGVLLYILLSGRLPFSGDEGMRCLSSILVD